MIPDEVSEVVSEEVPEDGYITLDALYIARPQVERWPEELLERYADSLPAAKRELDERRLRGPGLGYLTGGQG